MARKRSNEPNRVEKFLERFTPLTTVRRMRTKASYARAQGVTEGYESSGEDEPGPSGGGGWGYRKGRLFTRDVSNISYPAAVELVWKQYCGNPLARRLGEMRRDQVVNTEIRPKATEPKVQEHIDSFWDDPVNAMGVFCFQFGHQIGLFGSQIFPAFVSVEKSDGGIRGSGRVRLGYIDPARIKDIVLDLDNARIPIAVIEDRGAEGDKVYRVIHEDENPQSDSYGKLVGVRKREPESVRQAVREAAGDEAGDYEWVLYDHGVVSREQPNGKGFRVVRVSEAQGGIATNKMTRIDRGTEQAHQGSYEWEDENGVPYDGACFLFRVNHVMNGKYGWPDTLHLVDWLAQSDMFFFDIAERIFFLTAFVYDLLLIGADEAACDLKAKTTPAPKRGSLYVHNETEVMTPMSPDLGQADMKMAAEVLLHFIAGIGFGVPEAWLGAAQTSRYAGAKEASAPARKLLETRQRYIQSSIKHIVQFQIDQAILAKQLSEEIDTSFTVPNMPEISKEDMGSLAATLKIVAEGLAVAKAVGLVDGAAAIAVFSKIVDTMGVDVEIKAEMTLEEVREARDVLRLLQALKDTPLGTPLKLQDLLKGSEVTEDDITRAKLEFGELLNIAGMEEE